MPLYLPPSGRTPPASPRTGPSGDRRHRTQVGHTAMCGPNTPAPGHAVQRRRKASRRGHPRASAVTTPTGSQRLSWCGDPRPVHGYTPTCPPLPASPRPRCVLPSRAVSSQPWCLGTRRRVYEHQRIPTCPCPPAPLPGHHSTEPRPGLTSRATGPGATRAAGSSGLRCANPGGEAQPERPWKHLCKQATLPEPRFARRPEAGEQRAATSPAGCRGEGTKQNTFVWGRPPLRVELHLEELLSHIHALSGLWPRSHRVSLPFENHHEPTDTQGTSIQPRGTPCSALPAHC